MADTNDQDRPGSASAEHGSDISGDARDSAECYELAIQHRASRRPMSLTFRSALPPLSPSVLGTLV
eukprot:2211231-Pyramimonas_sp.AAC.1